MTEKGAMEKTNLEIMLEAGLSELGSELRDRVYYDDLLLAASVDDTQYDPEAQFAQARSMEERLLSIMDATESQSEVSDSLLLYRRRAVVDQFLLEHGIRLKDPHPSAQEEVAKIIKNREYLEEYLSISLTEAHPENPDYSKKSRALLFSLAVNPAGNILECIQDSTNQPCRHVYEAMTLIYEKVESLENDKKHLFSQKDFDNVRSVIKLDLEQAKYFFEQEQKLQEPLDALKKEIEADGTYPEGIYQPIINFLEKYREKPPAQ